MAKVIIDLCGGTGSWSAPYKNAGYVVRIIDPKTAPLLGIGGLSVWQYLYGLRHRAPGWEVHGILAAPPCTEFAVSGARWWKDKPPEKLRDAVLCVEHCLEIIAIHNPKFWALENPVGRIQKCVPQLGKPALYFDPCDYGDPYTKRTALWGNFTPPKLNPVLTTHAHGSSPIHRMAPGLERQALRSMTPPGFAQAFFEANP